MSLRGLAAMNSFPQRGSQGDGFLPGRGVVNDFESDSSAAVGIEVVVARLDIELEAVRALAALLSEAERQRASRLVFDRDRDRVVVARSRLRQLLGERLDIRPESVELAYGARGKPALASRFAGSGLRFNVSHAVDVAVYGLSSGREIGVDVEIVRPIREADAIAARFFSRHENAAYLALDSRDRTLGFFHCWTRKEAFIKALGDGLYHPLHSFDVSLRPGESARILSVASTPGDRCGWTLHSFVPEPGLVGAVAVEKWPHELASKVDPQRIVVRAPLNW